MQREATAVAQRHTTSQEVQSINARLHELQTGLASLESDTSEVRASKESLDLSQEAAASLQSDFGRLAQVLEGVQARHGDIEEQMTKVSSLGFAEAIVRLLA